MGGIGRAWEVPRKRGEAVRERKTQREETRMRTADWMGVEERRGWWSKEKEEERKKERKKRTEKLPPHSISPSYCCCVCVCVSVSPRSLYHHLYHYFLAT